MSTAPLLLSGSLYSLVLPRCLQTEIFVLQRERDRSVSEDIAGTPGWFFAQGGKNTEIGQSLPATVEKATGCRAMLQADQPHLPRGAAPEFFEVDA